MMNLALAFLSLLTVVSCALKPAGGNRNSSTKPCETKTALALANEKVDPNLITYTTHIMPLINSNCILCHSTSEGAPDVSSFQLLSANDFDLTKRVMKSLEEQRMPQNNPGLAPQILKIFSQWQTFGFLENPDSIPVGGVTYEVNIKPLIDRSCISCHDAGGQDPDLSSYDKIKANNFAIGRQSVLEVKEGDMPKLERLSKRETAMFAAWGESFGKSDDVVVSPDKEKKCGEAVP
jgi:hypothetical protein